MKRREFLSLAPLAPLVRLPQGETGARDAFDYIVVGGGSAGCVLANRLSADPKLRVLLLEAGASADSDPAITTPGRWVSLIGSTHDWGHRTEQEPGLGNRNIAFPRGRVLGGSSAINAMAHIRGHRRSFDRWRALGNDGFGYDDLLPLFKRSEKNDAGASAVRGGSGLLAVSHCADPHDGHRAFLDAASRLGFRADARFDFNAAAHENVAGFYQKNILNGRRRSASAAFLTPVLSRPNLVVRTGASATRVLFNGRRARGIAYVANGSEHQASCSRELILCGGAVESPKLLMLSGIGPGDHLRALGIDVLSNLPGVGSNLQDHLRLSIRYQGKTVLPGSTVSAGLFTWSRENLEATEAPDLQFYVGRGLETPDRFITITVSHTAPASRGEIRLRSKDPLAPPAIAARYLREEGDVAALVAGARIARRLAATPSYDLLRAEEIDPGPTVTSDADFNAFVRRAADSIFHPASTCAMGPEDDAHAVVGSDLRVRGVDGLRVADASVMPRVINAPTHPACVMLGEKAADLILGRPAA